jgi:hypothetical protein
MTAIDGVAAGQMSGRDLMCRTSQPEGTKVKLDHTRDGKRAQAELTLRTLLP